ncbi:MAG TPA: hypothetical protein VLH75_17205 [Longimicrobiales bacterium]|nr:hypothetical protein [Longimicrobiales bacterium]
MVAQLLVFLIPLGFSVWMVSDIDRQVPPAAKDVTVPGGGAALSPDNAVRATRPRPQPAGSAITELAPPALPPQMLAGAPDAVLGEAFDFYYDAYKQEIAARDAINARVSVPLGVIVLMVGAQAFLVRGYDPAWVGTGGRFFLLCLVVSMLATSLAAVYVAMAHIGARYYFMPNLIAVERYRQRLLVDRVRWPQDALDPTVEWRSFLIEAATTAATTNRKLNGSKADRLYAGNSWLIISLVFCAAAVVPFYALGGFSEPPTPTPPVTVILVDTMTEKPTNQTQPPEGSAPSSSGQGDQEAGRYVPPRRPALETMREGQLKPAGRPINEIAGEGKTSGE